VENFKVRLAALSLAAALAAATPVGAQQQSAAGFTTPAQHVTILDGASGALLYCDDCNTPMPPASMSKIMTVLMVAEALEAGRINLNTRYRVSENAWRHGAMSDGSHMFLELNSEVSVGDLLRGAIVVSANDACIVLAEGLFGSEEAFVAEMNRRAQALELNTARFRNSTGLPDPDHVISSHDLARLTRHLISAHPDIYRLYSEREFTFNRRTQQNRNPLLRRRGRRKDRPHRRIRLWARRRGRVEWPTPHHRLQWPQHDGRAAQRRRAHHARRLPRFQHCDCRARWRRGG
jgi:D-alanyl-D-alanine carboxypeptidase (penicillin-binding protein 5/6)